MVDTPMNLVPPPAAAPAGVGIRIRMYRVGFGDFFLMTVPAGTGLAHVLIDCGVHAGDIKSMPAAVARMKQDTGGVLALVIMTHRHADHISGFASQKDAFADFKVERVWMSWFENPKEPAAASFQANLTALARKLTLALAARNGPDDEQYLNMAGNIVGELGVAAGMSSNDLALSVLHGFTTPNGKPTPVDYYQAGDTPTLPPSLVGAGLTAKVLGPPIDPSLVAQMDGKNHQYLTADGEDEGAVGAPFSTVYRADASALPHAAFDLFDAGQLTANVVANQPELLAARAQAADNTINNQSLVVLFGFAGKTLLFSGDAQWGNWENFLFGGALGSPGHEGLTAASRAILGAIDFYKVGHHGSTNATPMDALAAMKPGLVAMCSTQPGAYGHEDKGTEVPRKPLLAALDARTNHQLARSDQVAAGAALNQQPSPGLPPLASPFTVGPQGFYIDYEL